MNLVDFLTARLNEDELIALDYFGRYGYDQWPQDLDHVLRDLAAKRALVRLAQASMWAEYAGNLQTAAWLPEHRRSQAGTCVQILRTLASVYADHADFDPEWSS